MGPENRGVIGISLLPEQRHGMGNAWVNPNYIFNVKSSDF